MSDVKTLCRQSGAVAMFDASAPLADVAFPPQDRHPADTHIGDTDGK